LAKTQRTTITILLAWLLAGTLDITAAFVYYVGSSATGAERLLQGIASGVLGAAAFTGGAATAVLGLLLHYLIALIWTVVLPLSNVRQAPIRVGPAITAAVILVCCIGLPISLVLAWLLRDSGGGSSDVAR